MPSDSRDRMVQSAVVLLAKQGYAATSFSEVLAHSHAPRGSIYHHFPEGKDQLIAAAVETAGSRAVALLDSLEGAEPEAVVDGFMAMWRSLLVYSEFSAGCSVLAVTVSASATSTDLLTGAGTVFRTWTDRLAELFAIGGIEGPDAAALATTVIAASEGAVVLARAQRDLSGFDAVHAQLRVLTAAHTPSGAPQTGHSKSIRK